VESGAAIQNFPFEGPGIIRVTILAGQEVPNHYHHYSHSFVYVVEGEGTVFLNGQDHPVKIGDVIYYPPKHVHGFKAGKKDLILLAVENPPSTKPDGSRDTVFV
jgi:quercetin dioxygenase-like cupin family protein